VRGRAVGAVALVCSCSAVQCSAASDLAGMVLNGRGGQDGNEDGVAEAIASLINGEGSLVAGWATVAEEVERREDVKSAKSSGWGGGATRSCIVLL